MSGLGGLLRTWRERALLTQEDLAERAGLNVRTIRGLETGAVPRPRSASLRQLATALRLDDEEQKALIAAARSAPAPRTPVSTPPSRVPRQLPADAAELVGRTPEMAALDAGPIPSAVVISVIDGMAGVGKTALAVHAAHQWADRYPDGQLFLDLHGFTEGYAPVDPGEALDRMLRALEVPGGRIPAELDERSALFRSLLAGRRVLIVLDNAASETQVAPLLPGTAGCLVIVTSRRRLTGLDPTRAVSLEVLPPDEAVRLFVHTVGPGRLDAEPRAALAEVVELCGRLPLALRIAAARLRSRTAWTVAHLIERLRDHRDRLAELESGERGIAAALDLSAQQLTDEQRRAYRLLGLHPGADQDAYAAAALIDADLGRTRHLLDDLLDDHLLTELTPGRYAFHDLTRGHAAGLAAREEQAASAALARLFDYYADTASVAMDAAYPFERERRPRHAAPAGTPTPVLDDLTVAVAWLDVELPNLLATARLAPEAGRPEHAPYLSATLNRYLGASGRDTDAVVLHEVALAAATAAGDRAGEVLALTGLGLTHQRLGRNLRASELCGRALAVARSAGDRTGAMEALIGVAMVQRMRGMYDEAADTEQDALRLARALGHRPGEMEALIGLGHLHRLRARYADAVAALEPALALARELGHRTGERNALSALGWVYLGEGRYERAGENFAGSLAVASADGFRTGELNSLIGLGAADRLCGRYASAAERYERALELADDIGNRNMRFEAVHGLGRVRQATGRPDEALAQHRHALDLATELDQPYDVARAHDGLAHAHRSLGQTERARHHWNVTLDLLDQLGIDHTEDAEANVPAIRAHLADLDGARPGSES